MALGACGGSPPADSASLEGADLVVGTSLARHGLLVVPRAGGTAELRALEDPATVRWRGTRTLPPSIEAHPAGGYAALLRTDRQALLYDPASGSLRSLGKPPEDARWVPVRDGGAWVGATGALLVRGSESRTIEVEGSLVWAAPAPGGRTVALVRDGGAQRLLLWERGEKQPSSSVAVEARGPALLAAWGREVLVPEGDRPRLVGHGLPQLEAAEHARLEAPPVTLVSSPSEHRVFATLADDDSRIVAWDRYGWGRRGEWRIPGTVREVRSSPLGEWLFARTDKAVWGVEVGGSRAVEIPGAWRPDLPLGLPRGRVLVAAPGGLEILSRDGSRVAVLEGPADAWWLPIRWHPGAGRPRPAPVREAENVSPDSTAPSQLQEVGLTTLGRVEGRAVAPAARGRGRAQGMESDTGLPRPPRAGETVDLPPGFYAVVNSSRSLQGIETLRRALERTGYSTRVLPRRDEADEVWYRLMVGPYGSRDEAEDVVRRLERERGIAAWIREIGGDPQEDG